MKFVKGVSVTPAQLTELSVEAAESLAEHQMLYGLELEIWQSRGLYHLTGYWQGFGNQLKSSYTSVSVKSNVVGLEIIQFLQFIVKYKL